MLVLEYGRNGAKEPAISCIISETKTLTTRLVGFLFIVPNVVAVFSSDVFHDNETKLSRFFLNSTFTLKFISPNMLKLWLANLTTLTFDETLRKILTFDIPCNIKISCFIFEHNAEKISYRNDQS